MSVCPSGEKCSCGDNNGKDRYEWDVEEVVGYTDVNLQLDSGGIVKTRVFGNDYHTKSAKIAKLKMLFALVDSIKSWCIAHKDLEPARFQPLIDSYNEFVGSKYPQNRDVAITPEYVREGIRIFANTNHAIQELDPSSPDFQAVNKPKTISYYEDAPVQGRDRKLRSFHRRICIKVASRGECFLQRLMIHELAHTPANHLCFREDDHDSDFRIFQALFTEIAVRAGFFSENGRMSGDAVRAVATKMV